MSSPELRPPPPPVISITGSLILAVVVFILLRLRLRRRRRADGLPPGNEGFPIIGETLRLISAYKTSNPEPFIDDRIAAFGRVFTTHVFGERTVFSTDPAFNRLVLRRSGGGEDLFECSYPSSISTLLGRHSLLLLRGARHRRLHSLTISRFAASAKLREALLPEIDKIVRQTMLSWGENVRLLEQAKRIGFDLAVHQIMGRDPGEWSENLRRHYLLVINGFFSVPMPPFLASLLGSLSAYGRAIKARTKVAEALMEVVRSRREERKERRDWNAGKGKVMETDMLDDLLEAEEGLSDEEVVDFMLALLVAGYETTSTIMTLAVKFLTESPRALSCIKAEHDEIRAKKRDEKEPLDWSDYKSMPFTQCVINETLRVGNIISGVFRRTVKDIEFKGYTIPKGCKLFASFRAVHMDPEYYTDARTFNPWRWQDKDNPAQQTGCNGSSTFTPFGGGQRLCPGYELARLEIAVFLHYLLTWFTWEEAEEDRLVFFPTTRTLKSYPIKLRRRHARQ